MRLPRSEAAWFEKFGLRCRRAFAVLACIGLALACSVPPAFADTQTPGQLILVNSERMMRALNERHDEFTAHPEALHRYIRSEFLQSYDRVYSAQLVIGDNVKASDADLQAFANALSDHLLDRYGSSLLKIQTGLHVKILSELSLRDGTLVKVSSLVDRANAPPIEVDYLLHQNAGQWQVFDVIVEGISFVQTFRFVFADILRSKPLPEVTADLRAGRILGGTVTTDQLMHKP